MSPLKNKSFQHIKKQLQSNSILSRRTSRRISTRGAKLLASGVLDRRSRFTVKERFLMHLIITAWQTLVSQAAATTAMVSSGAKLMTW